MRQHIIPVLPRTLLDHITLPFPVILGITHRDYEEVLRTTSPHDRKVKTWVFLDWALASGLPQEPSFMPFDTPLNMQDEDPRSGIRIVWGTMDQEFS